jgi:hypothetical protein
MKQLSISKSTYLGSIVVTRPADLDHIPKTGLERPALDDDNQAAFLNAFFCPERNNLHAKRFLDDTSLSV